MQTMTIRPPSLTPHSPRPRTVLIDPGRGKIKIKQSSNTQKIKINLKTKIGKNT